MEKELHKLKYLMLIPLIVLVVVQCMRSQQPSIQPLVKLIKFSIKQQEVQNLSEIASAASVEVNPVDGSSVSNDIDGDYIPDDEDGDRKKKFDPTPIIMDAIDDSDMIDEEGNTKIRSKINDNHPKDTVMKSNTSRVVSLNTTGGGTNTLIDMGNDNTKVATFYNRARI